MLDTHSAHCISPTLRPIGRSCDLINGALHARSLSLLHTRVTVGWVSIDRRSQTTPPPTLSCGAVTQGTTTRHTRQQRSKEESQTTHRLRLFDWSSFVPSHHNRPAASARVRRSKTAEKDRAREKVVNVVITDLIREIEIVILVQRAHTEPAFLCASYRARLA
jgi:hypothetical protein